MPTEFPTRRSLVAASLAAGALAPLAVHAAPPPPPAPPSYPPLVGPKKRVAVIKFSAITKFEQAYGSSDAGGGLAAALATELVESGQFLVVERAELASVLSEQELGARGAVTAETAAKVGALLGAQFLIVGAVTSFDADKNGSGFSMGFGGFGGGDMGAGVGTRTMKGTVNFDFRVIDTSTGQIVAATHVKASTKQSSSTVGLMSHGVVAGPSNFASTPLGEASRDAILQGVMFIVGKLKDVAWLGRVTDVSGDQVFISAGTANGVKAGDRFLISRVSRKITDPSSGEVLGNVEDKLGLVQVALVQDRFSIAAKLSDFTPSRGDLARYAAS
jgi:curli biogenesis system outer membrane secretion channel CsgG